MTCKDCVHHDICECAGRDICEDFKDKSRFIELPCKVGDTVYCDICNEGKGYYYDACIIKSIVFEADYPEPLFTAVSREKAEYQTYWASDFGKTIFLQPHYIKPVKKKGRSRQ